MVEPALVPIPGACERRCLILAPLRFGRNPSPCATDRGDPSNRAEWPNAFLFACAIDNSFRKGWTTFDHIRESRMTPSMPLSCDRGNNRNGGQARIPDSACRLDERAPADVLTSRSRRWARDSSSRSFPAALGWSWGGSTASFGWERAGRAPWGRAPEYCGGYRTGHRRCSNKIANFLPSDTS